MTSEPVRRPGFRGFAFPSDDCVRRCVPRAVSSSGLICIELLPTAASFTECSPRYFVPGSCLRSLSNTMRRQVLTLPGQRGSEILASVTTPWPDIASNTQVCMTSVHGAGTPLIIRFFFLGSPRLVSFAEAVFSTSQFRHEGNTPTPRCKGSEIHGESSMALRWEYEVTVQKLKPCAAR